MTSKARLDRAEKTAAVAASGTPVPQARPSAKRSRHHEAILLAFVEKVRVADVAQAAAVSQRTVERWAANPDNWAEVLRARRECLDETLSIFRTSMPKMATRLISIGLGTTDVPATTVRALVASFEAFARLSERVEQEQRISRLEQLIASGATPRVVYEVINPYPPDMSSRPPTVRNPYAANTEEEP